MYLSAIAIDFGSTNSGAARIDSMTDGRLVYSKPQFCHSDGHYPKDATWFVISPDLLEKAAKDYEVLRDQDFRILSRLLPKTKDPNVVWGKDILTRPELFDTRAALAAGWQEFKNFKMMIYVDVPYVTSSGTYPIALLVKLFLRILKIECLAVERNIRGKDVDSEDIQWGVTVPSIWTPENQKLMADACQSVFGAHVRLLSEPEGPLVSERVHASGKGELDCKPGRLTLVVDAGGGTTDLALLEDEVNPTTGEEDFKLASGVDGIGVAGNKIDSDFWKFFLREISRGLKDDHGNEYDKMSDESLSAVLLEPYYDDFLRKVILDQAWLKYKHGYDESFKIPKDYRKWLMAHGHNQVADKVVKILTGEEDLDPEKLYAEVYLPTYEKIVDSVRRFVKNHQETIMQHRDQFTLTFAGGLSLAKGLRDMVLAAVVDVLKFPIQSNLTAGMSSPLLTAGSIMDGVAYVIINRKVIQRQADFYVYFDTQGSLFGVKNTFDRLGSSMKFGELNDIADEDVEKYGAIRNKTVVYPVSLKNGNFQDYEGVFDAINEDQKTIEWIFYGSDKIVVHPTHNSACWELGRVQINHIKGHSYRLVVDFNESNTGSLHYYLQDSETNEQLAEGSVLMKRPRK